MTSLTSCKVKFEWHSSHQHVFDKIKKIIGTEVLLFYPDFNKPVLFHLYTDASDYQLGAVIMQDKMPIAFYSRKLNTAQNGIQPLKEAESCYQLLKLTRNKRISC
jgi:hypothetical protein